MIQSKPDGLLRQQFSLKTSARGTAAILQVQPVHRRLCAADAATQPVVRTQWPWILAQNSEPPERQSGEINTGTHGSYVNAAGGQEPR